MSQFDGRIELAFGDGEYTFRLRLRELFELEEKCNAGIAELVDRIYSSQWRARDVFETIRLGLIGGGMSAVDALKKVNMYCDDRPWVENMVVARAVLGHAFVGPEQPKKKRARRKAVKSSPPAM